MRVRQARWSDVPALVALIEQRRGELEALAPRFWRKAGHSAAWTRRYYRFLLLSRHGWIILAEEQGRVTGFLTARRAKVPPVYDPGPTILVDDFCVAAPDLWPSVGGALVGHLRELAGPRRWVQMVVAVPSHDSAAMAFMADAGLSSTSTWWTSTF